MLKRHLVSKEKEKKTIINSLQRQGIKILPPNKIVKLPNKPDSVVVQYLTVRQIDAIPKERYNVQVLTSMKLAGRDRLKKQRLFMQSYRRHLRRYCDTDVKRIDFAIAKLFDKKQNESNLEELFLTMIKLSEQFQDTVGTFYTGYRKYCLKHGPGDDGPSDIGLFFPPINENEMADCVKTIMDKYFRNQDTCIVCGVQYNMPEFCLLMHFLFQRFKLLKKTALQPFCLFLHKKVYPGKKLFTTKTLNNYAHRKALQDVKPGFTNQEPMSIDFSFRPVQKESSLKEAFQEIGWTFRKSVFFTKMREQKGNMHDMKF